MVLVCIVGLGLLVVSVLFCDLGVVGLGLRCLEFLLFTLGGWSWFCATLGAGLRLCG